MKKKRFSEQQIVKILKISRSVYRHQAKKSSDDEIIELLQEWAKQHQVKLDFIEPGKPAQNAYIERFNRTYQEEILDMYLFHSLQEARDITEEWLEEYNAIRPHKSLGGLPPYQYAIQATP